MWPVQSKTAMLSQPSPLWLMSTGSHCGNPVLIHRKPGTTASGVHAPAWSDDFRGMRPGPQWFWQGNPMPQWWSLPRPGTLRLACRRDPEPDLRKIPHLLGQRMPGTEFRMETSVELRPDAVGARAGVTVIGRSYAWLGIERRHEGLFLVHRAAQPDGRERDLAAPRPVPQARVALTLTGGPGAECRFSSSAGGTHEPFPATPGVWVGASVSLFAAAPAGDTSHAGHADFGPVVFPPAA
jgi:beta-xylosidase